MSKLGSRVNVDKLKALIIRPSALGDTLLLAPALYQIADKTEFTLLGRIPRDIHLHWTRQRHNAPGSTARGTDSGPF